MSDTRVKHCFHLDADLDEVLGVLRCIMEDLGDVFVLQDGPEEGRDRGLCSREKVKEDDLGLALIVDETGLKELDMFVAFCVHSHDTSFSKGLEDLLGLLESVFTVDEEMRRDLEVFGTDVLEELTETTSWTFKALHRKRVDQDLHLIL